MRNLMGRIPGGKGLDQTLFGKDSKIAEGVMSEQPFGGNLKSMTDSVFTKGTEGWLGAGGNYGGPRRIN